MLQLNIIKKITLLSLSACMLYACGNQTNNSSSKKVNSGYLTATYCHVTNKNDVYAMSTLKYDLESGKESKISEIKYESQYPLTYYDESTNLVFYTKKVNGSDQVFGYNTKTKKSVQYTSSLYGINDIKKISDDELLVLGCAKTDIIHPYIINTKSKAIKEYSYNREMFNTDAYLYKKDEIIFGTYDYDAYNKLVDTYNKQDEQKQFTATGKIVSFNLKTKKYKVLFKEDKGVILSVVANGNDFYYRRSRDSVELGEIIHYNSVTKKKELLDLDVKKDEVNDLIALENNKLIYTSDQSISIYNLDSKKTDVVMSQDVEGKMNNADYIQVR